MEGGYTPVGGTFAGADPEMGMDTSQLRPFDGTTTSAQDTFPTPDRCGSDFWINLCRAFSTPWFMVGRLAHRLKVPNAGWIGLGLIICTVLAQVLFLIGADELNSLPGGARAGLIIASLFFFSAIVFFSASVRHAFRASRSLPGSFTEDLSHTFCCCPFYWRTDTCTSQRTYPFQLALVAVATEPTLASGEESGAPKEGPGTRPTLPALGKWSTDLFGCKCTRECEGDIVMCSCALLWSWWMQTRIAKRIGLVDSFAKVGCLLFAIESIPDIWGIIADAAGLIGSTTESVVTVVTYIPATLLNVWLRMQVRARYRIEESFVCEDVLVSFFCYPCAVAQADRELTIRGESSLV